MYINKLMFGFLMAALLIACCVSGFYWWHASSKLSKQEIALNQTSEELATTKQQLTGTQQQVTSTQQQLTTAQQQLTAAQRQLTVAQQQLDIIKNGGVSTGTDAPDFTLICNDGSTITLSSLHGSKVILSFWSASCPYCRKENSIVQQMHVKYPSVPILRVAGTALGPVDPDAVREYLKDNGFTFTVPLDSTGQVDTLYGISGVPTTIFLDSNGIIRQLQKGAFDDLSQLETMFNSY